ncbi:hypothetical protein [Acidovorax sp.]|uniref:hypothetical protein n=1 Tax=Acidovorax sp. TaxID=1872122 RepID=UPI002ACE39A4|nr:hypothetical protein [Acidovorax sp.]MDZ7864383.1 hypothetical protein [Acidovorax sp.]
MERAIELAGFFAAHGIWCVAEGEPLTPMLAQESAAYGRNMLRFAADQLEDGVAQAQEYLDQNPGQAERAARACHRPFHPREGLQRGAVQGALSAA